MNFLISFSLSTTILTATDCTRPADNPLPIFLPKTGEIMYPNNRSIIRRAFCASTKSLFNSPAFFIAVKIASFVIALNLIRLYLRGFKTSNKDCPIASPSRSSSAAIYRTSAFFIHSVRLLTTSFFNIT